MIDIDVHGILLCTENNYFYFSMPSSSLYSVLADWLHEYYTSSVRCHSSSWLEPVSLTLPASLRLRQIKLYDSSRVLSRDVPHVVTCTSQGCLSIRKISCRNATWYGLIHQAKYMSLNREDNAEILTLREVVFKCYAHHGKRISYIWVTEGASYWHALNLSVKNFTWPSKVSRAWIYTFLHSTSHSAVHSPMYEAS